MNQFTSLRQAIMLTLCLYSAQAYSQAAPAEKTTAQIKHTTSSANPVVVTLSKNLFKTESYQAPYTVQVPYQDTETDTVEVPYEVTETYDVQVPYQDTETYTENVPYTVDVPYTDYETDYRQEYRCTDVTRYREECHNEQQCYTIPGNNGGGGQNCREVEECGTNAQGQRICKTRTVCDGGTVTPPQQRCEDRRVCNNVPYNDQQCSYVQVPYQREVTRHRQETRYRQETRTRTVTRYRTETRTRTVTKTRTETRTREVTKYRNEEKCCVTKTREVFDRQLQYNVSIVFPQEAVLKENETETLTVTLASADANSAQVQVQVVSSIFGYKIAQQNVSGASIQVDLAITPKFDLSNAGVSTIQKLRLDYVSSAQKLQASFTDGFSSSRVQSSYSLVISDLASGQLIEELPVVTLPNGQLGAVLKTALDSQAKIKATLKVVRQGVMVVGGQISFETSVNFEKRSLQPEDVKSLSDPKNIAAQLTGAGLQSALVIQDSTPEFSDVSTEYAIFLDLKTDSGSKPLNTKTFTREELKQSGMAALMSVVIKHDVAYKNALQKGQVIKFSVIATRKSSSNLLNGKLVKATVSGSVTIQ